MSCFQYEQEDVVGWIQATGVIVNSVIQLFFILKTPPLVQEHTVITLIKQYITWSQWRLVLHLVLIVRCLITIHLKRCLSWKHSSTQQFLFFMKVRTFIIIRCNISMSTKVLNKTMGHREGIPFMWYTNLTASICRKILIRCSNQSKSYPRKEGMF